MAIKFLFPDGRKKALTLSYDDGQIHDLKLLDIFNQHGLKGTFHLNSMFLNGKDHVDITQLATIYAGHEIACHSVSHPFLERLAPGEAMREVWNDRCALEQAAGYPVAGMSYPFGTYNDQVVDILKNAGILYSRTTAATHSFALPNNYLLWHPTCHHREMLEMTPRFLDLKYDYSVFYVWGHSFEFHRNQNWDDMEKFADLVAGKPDIWYATNMEIYRYDQAVRHLVVSTDGHMIYNPSAETVWCTANNQTYQLTAGQTCLLP